MLKILYIAWFSNKHLILGFFFSFVLLLFCNILTFLVPEALWFQRICLLLLWTSKWRLSPIDYFGLTNDTNISYSFCFCVWNPDALCHCTKLHMKSINARKMAIKPQLFKSRESKLLCCPDSVGFVACFHEKDFLSNNFRLRNYC